MNSGRGPHAFAKDESPYFTFEYIHEGKGELEENGGRFTLIPGDLIIL
jgi:quercetin dioxygenase-like cupin family protein